MSHRICPELRQKFKKGAPSARHYAPFQVEYLPLFSARVARSKAIGFKKISASQIALFWSPLNHCACRLPSLRGHTLQDGSKD